MKKIFLVLLTMLLAGYVFADYYSVGKNNAENMSFDKGALPSSFNYIDDLGYDLPVRDYTNDITGSSSYSLYSMAEREALELSYFYHTGNSGIVLSEQKFHKHSVDMGGTYYANECGFDLYSLNGIVNQKDEREILGYCTSDEYLFFGYGYANSYMQSTYDLYKSLAFYSKPYILNKAKHNIYSGKGAFCVLPNDEYARKKDRYSAKEVNNFFVIIGWDDNYNKDNFINTDGKTPLENGAFLCRNLFGKDFGDNGYFWLSYEDKIYGIYFVEYKDKNQVSYNNQLSTVDILSLKYDNFYSDIYKTPYDYDRDYYNIIDYRYGKTIFVLDKDCVLSGVKIPQSIRLLNIDKILNEEKTVWVSVNGKNIWSKNFFMDFHKGFITLDIPPYNCKKGDTVMVTVDFNTYYDGISFKQYYVPVTINDGKEGVSFAWSDEKDEIDLALYPEDMTSKRPRVIPMAILVDDMKHVESISLNKKAVTVAPQKTFYLTATVLPEDADYRDFEWETSDPEIVTVDDNGMIRGKSIGRATVWAETKDGHLKAECQVDVRDNYVAPVSVSLSESQVIVAIGDFAAVRADVLPLNATNRNVIWSSDNSAVAEVKDGIIIGKGRGIAQITATTLDGDLTAVCQAVVTDSYIPVTGIAFDKDFIELKVGEKASVKANVLPADATNRQYTWTVLDSDIIDFNKKTGEITALKAGTSYIVAVSEQNGFISFCKVKVREEEISVVIDPAEITVNVGEIVALNAKVLPESTEDKNLTCTSSNTKIVKVNAKGEFKAYAGGTAVVTAKASNGASAVCRITVINIPVEKVVLDPASITVNVGDIVALNATVYPENASNKSLEWRSDNTSVVKVNTKGEFKSYKAGTATVYVRTVDGKKVASCKIKVVNIPVERVELDKTSVSVKVGDIVPLHAIIFPDNASNKKVSWKSSDKNIIKVNTSGEFKAYKKGTAVVTVMTEDGNKVATCVVTVK